MQDYVERLRAVVVAAEPRLLALSEARASRRATPGAWSPKEILGHLVDSASVNHERFVRAQRRRDLVFPGYDQDAWVAAQDHQAAPWHELVGLWAAMNRHVARVMGCAPEAERLRARHPHNLHEIGWQAVPAEEPTTLDVLMRDYVGHLEHHLAAILTAG